MLKKSILTVAVVFSFVACQSSTLPSSDYETGVTSSASASTSASGAGADVEASVDAGVDSSVEVSVATPCLTSDGKRRLPDPALTPGKLCTKDDPDFKELRYPGKIAYCQRHITKKMKDTVAKAYGIAEADYSKYEFDHYIPLAAGGANDVTNLWPQPLSDANKKDVVEDKVYTGLKSGAISQADAVTAIRAWKPADCQ